MAEKSRLERAVDAVEAELDDGSVVFLVGRAHKLVHGPARRVIWIPVPSPIQFPKQAGGRLPDEDPTIRARVARERIETVEIHIYAEDRGTTDRLLDNLIAAILLSIPRAQLQTYSWVSEEEQEAGDTNYVELIVMRCAFPLPVLDEVLPLKAIATITDVCGTTQADGTVTPQPAT